jgi:plasmid stability protein
MLHALGMPVMIQVRNVPEDIHEKLVRRARARGQTLTDYIQGILEREVAKPDRVEVVERILRRGPIGPGGLRGAELIREARREAGRE